MSTAKQRERQEYRETTGRYSKVKPCNRCGKSAGLDYYSDPRHANCGNNETLILCRPCVYYLFALPDDEFESDINSPRYGKMPQGKPTA